MLEKGCSQPVEQKDAIIDRKCQSLEKTIGDSILLVSRLERLLTLPRNEAVQEPDQRINPNLCYLPGFLEEMEERVGQANKTIGQLISRLEGHIGDVKILE